MVAALAIVSCGSKGDADAVVRVGATAISGATINHWSSVMAGGRLGLLSLSCKGLERRRRAVQLLITSHWLIGEATERALKPSSGRSADS